jgi:hypothetical protein
MVIDMQLSDADKKYILNEFLRNISHISDEAYQRRIWILGEGPECDDFDESMCHFFDDGAPILSDYKNFGITDAQYDLLIKLRDQLDHFSQYNYPPQKFIESLEWKKIMMMAKEVLEAFNYQKTSS